MCQMGQPKPLQKAYECFCYTGSFLSPKVSSVATDGASITTASVAGVGKLLQKYNAVMIQIHRFVAHRLVLAAGQTTTAVISFNECQRNLKLVYMFYHDRNLIQLLKSSGDRPTTRQCQNNNTERPC